MGATATKEEKQLGYWMAMSAFLYFSGGLVFLLFPRPLLLVLDSLGKIVHLAPVLPGAMLAERFWNLLAFSMAMTITTASVVVVRNPAANKDFCIPVIFSKVASWLSALVYFLVVSRAFAHLVIFLVDFPLFALTVFFYRRARTAADSSG
ncbi:MAG: hypothetical protein LAP13_11575 [Acidobacteriia bacterium]|nr:hypothetical protein [Terriglobia bacterium]